MQTMQNVFTPMANLYQSQLEASRQLADAVFSGTEKIDQVVLEATHRAVNEQLKFAQSLVSVRDMQSMTEAQTTFLSQRPDRVMDYQRELMRVFTEVQSELGKSLRNYFEQLSNSAVSGASAFANANDTASNTFNPFNNMFSAWESVLREGSSLANRNMNAARDAFDSAVNTATSNMNTAAGYASAASANAGITSAPPAAKTAVNEAVSEAINVMASDAENKATGTTRRK